MSYRKRAGMKAVVSLNSGSSSFNVSLVVLDTQVALQFSAGGKIEKIGIAPGLKVRSVEGAILLERDWPDGASLSHADLLADLFAWAAEHPLEGREIIAIGHRVDRKSVVWGKSVSVRVDTGGSRIIKKKKKKTID